VHVLKGEYGGTAFLGDNPSNPIIDIFAGGHQAAALAQDGTLYTWGTNTYGGIGNDSYIAQHTPVRVHKGINTPYTTFLGDDPNNPVVLVGTGKDHLLAIGKDGYIYSWGANQFGQLGDGGDRHWPVPKGVIFLRTVRPRLTAGLTPEDALCAGAMLEIDVDAGGVFNQGNVFTAELSDPQGDFTVPVMLGSIVSTTSGRIQAVLPTSLPTSSEYRVRITSSNPAVISEPTTQSLFISGLPIADVSPNGATVFCEGDSVVLSANPGFSVYRWSTGDTTSSITVRASGSYSLSVLNDAGCTSTSPAIDVIVIPRPEIPTVTVGRDQMLSSTPAPSYQWLFNGEPIPGATQQSYQAQMTGRYSVRVENAQGCASVSDEVDVTVVINAVTGTDATTHALSITPHPIVDQVTLQLTLPQSGSVDIRVVDVRGEVVLSESEQRAGGDYHRTLQLSELPSGTYFIEVRSGKDRWVSHVVKQ
jgi:hypothetical protein